MIGQDLIDARFMRQALTCCLARMLELMQIDDYRVGSSDRTVNGDAGSVDIRFSIQIVN